MKRCYYIYAHFSKISFAHIFHLCTEMYIICAHFCCYICSHVFTPLPWPAAGISLNQGTTNKVSSLLPQFTGLDVKSFRSRLPRGHVRIYLKESLYHLTGFASFLYASPQVYRLTFSFFHLKPSYKFPHFPGFVLKCSIWLVYTDPRAVIDVKI